MKNETFFKKFLNVVSIPFSLTHFEEKANKEKANKEKAIDFLIRFSAASDDCVDAFPCPQEEAF